MSGYAAPQRSIYAALRNVKSQRRAGRSLPRTLRHWRPKVLSWAGPAAFYRNRFYEVDRWYKARLTPPPYFPEVRTIEPSDYAATLDERLAEQRHIETGGPTRAPVDIGFALERPRSRQLTDKLDDEQRRELERAARHRTLELDAEALDGGAEDTERPARVRLLAQHDGIFADLFHVDAFFHPIVPLRVAFDYDDEHVSPVFHGNFLAPTDARSPPHVSWPTGDDALWSLLMLNPDGNAYAEGRDVLHWFVGNVRGADLASADVLCDYLQPVPFRGTGFHRVAFVLFKHARDDEPIDFGDLQLSTPCDSLERRSFSTADFYKRFEERLTPAGLAWCQMEWDASCQKCMHGRLGMEQPHYEYEWPEVAPPDQEEFPDEEQPFDVYLDRYRPHLEVEEQLLKQRLERISPFKADEPPPGNLVGVGEKVPYWRFDDKLMKNIGKGKFRSLYVNKLE